MESSDKSVQCVVVTPEKAVLDEPVDFVALPMYDGELGVLPGRAPLIGRLGYGELRTRRANDIRRFYVDGGFVQVRANVVTVLTPKAIRAENINAAAAEEALEKAKGLAKTPEEQTNLEKAQQRARAQLAIARRGHEEVRH